MARGPTALWSRRPEWRRPRSAQGRRRPERHPLGADRLERIEQQRRRGRPAELFHFRREVLGEKFCQVYGGVKATEYDEFLQVISPWEREHLLLNV